jgi:hypothetical protein
MFLAESFRVSLPSRPRVFTGLSGPFFRIGEGGMVTRDGVFIDKLSGMELAFNVLGAHFVNNGRGKKKLHAFFLSGYINLCCVFFQSYFFF